MIGVGIGALVSTAWLGRNINSKSPWRVDPTLWRTWAMAGAAASFFFYLLEFFPGHLGWNLEVNHPLYALGWLGAGDLLCRTSEWILRGTAAAVPEARRRIALAIAIDVLMIAALPFVVELTSPATFPAADRFMWAIAADYILESGGSGGIITPIFFIGATAGAALAPWAGVPIPLLASVGMVALLAAAANTPIAAAVMAMELLPGSEGVYAALAAATAFLIVGHRS